MTDDNASMMLAYEQFMMQNKNNTKQKQLEKQEKENEKKCSQEELFEKRRKEVQRSIDVFARRNEKRYWQFFQTFTGRVRDEWMDLDKQALQVLQAISGIRNRLPMHARMLDGYKERQLVYIPQWKRHGFAKDIVSKEEIREEDVQSALMHDLLQHEKMLEGLRMLFANLSESHDSILRYVDDVMKHHLECLEDLDGLLYQQEEEASYDDVSKDLEIPSSFERASSLPDVINDVMSMLSMELCRKQCLLHKVLGSVEDDLIKGKDDDVAAKLGGSTLTKSNNGNEEDDWDDLNPEAISNCVVKRWSLGSQFSCLDSAIFENVLTM